MVKNTSLDDTIPFCYSMLDKTQFCYYDSSLFNESLGVY